MGDLSEHFSRREFACKCGCGFDTVDVRLLELLEDIRTHFNAPVRINSGCRCKSHNKKVGGAKKSQHLYGRAADIKVDGIQPKHVYEYISTLETTKYGIGNYATFTHVDSRTGYWRKRWAY